MKNNIVNVKCSRCDVGLLDIMVVDEEADIDFTIVAYCDYCGGKSEQQTFHGLLQQAATEWCDIIDIDIDEDEGLIKFYTKKATGVR